MKKDGMKQTTVPSNPNTKNGSDRAPMHNVDRHLSAEVVKKSHPTGHSRKN